MIASGRCFSPRRLGLRQLGPRGEGLRRGDNMRKLLAQMEAWSAHSGVDMLGETHCPFGRGGYHDYGWHLGIVPPIDTPQSQEAAAFDFWCRMGEYTPDLLWGY